MAEFLHAIGEGGSAGPDFREAYEIQKVVEAGARIIPVKVLEEDRLTLRSQQRSPGTPR